MSKESRSARNAMESVEKNVRSAKAAKKSGGPAVGRPANHLGVVVTALVWTDLADAAEEQGRTVLVGLIVAPTVMERGALWRKIAVMSGTPTLLARSAMGEERSQCGAQRVRAGARRTAKPAYPRDISAIRAMK